MTRTRRLAAALAGVVAAAGLAPAAASAQSPSTIPIGQVQGAVGPDADGDRHRSPFAPASGNGSGAADVQVQGVITQLTLARTSSGARNYGFFVQNTAATADGDPATSDGIFVFHSTFTTLRTLDPAVFYTPKVGDEVVLRGRVNEFFNFTQLSSPRVMGAPLRSGAPITRGLLSCVKLKDSLTRPRSTISSPTFGV